MSNVFVLNTHKSRVTKVKNGVRDFFIRHRVLDRATFVMYCTIILIALVLAATEFATFSTLGFVFGVFWLAVAAYWMSYGLGIVA